MNKVQTAIPGVTILEPRVFSDDRGFFFESYSDKAWGELGLGPRFVQDNHSFSLRGVIRGLHYQIEHAQGKLVRAAVGEILDVAVDIRRNSPTFGKWESVRLSGENKRMLWIPPGFAHGFAVLSECAHLLYKTTDFYFPQAERSIRWDDPTLNINWQLDIPPVVSAKDQQGKAFNEAELFS